MTADILKLIKFDFSSKEPLSDQFSRAVSEAVGKGRLKAGERLPTLKEWSSGLGVGMYVVRRAMAKLSKLGVVHVRRHSGVIVAEASFSSYKGKVVYVSVDRGNIWARSVFSFHLGEALKPAGYRYEHVMIAGKKRDKVWTKEDFDFSHLRRLIKEGVSFAWVECSARFVVEPLIEAGVPFAVCGEIHCPEAVGVFHHERARTATHVVSLMKAAKCKSVMHVGYGRWITGGPMSSALFSSDIKFSRIALDSADAATECDSFYRAAMAEFEKRLSRGTSWLPDAFIFDDDYVASGALFALAHHGIESPRDVKVVAFANKGHLPVYINPLTRIENDPVRCGREVAKYIVSALRGGRRHLPDIAPKLIRGATL